MALILKKKKSNYSSWYQKNNKQLSEKRKKQYAEDPEYREQRLEDSRRYRRGERTLMTPPEDAPISFAQGAEHIGVGISTLHEWRRKKYFPEPKHHNGRRLWFTEKQVLLLLKLKEVIRVYGRRREKIKRDRLKEVVASIRADWD